MVNTMNVAIRSNALIVVDPSEASASSGFAEQQSTVSVDKDVLKDVLARAAKADPAELQHVVSVVMRALAEYPSDLHSTIEAYTGAIALAVSTGKTVLLHFSHTPEGCLEAAATVPEAPGITRALERGRQRVADILKGPEMLSARKFAAMIGVSTQALNEWREQRKVLALSGAKRGFRYPDWQVLDETGERLPGLVELHRVLGDQPWSVFRFLRQRHAALGDRTGIESLKSGDIDATIAAAKGVSETFN
jgi:hypothetical protein